ncbi:MAG: septum formation initiator family protein [Prevotella sp.]
MNKLNPIWSFIGANKYWIVTILGVLIVGFVDDNSLLQHARNLMQIKDLEEQIDDYNERYNRDNARLRELRSDPRAITKTAREKYFMKADDEDIFVLSTDIAREREQK